MILWLFRILGIVIFVSCASQMAYRWRHNEIMLWVNSLVIASSPFLIMAKVSPSYNELLLAGVLAFYLLAQVWRMSYLNYLRHYRQEKRKKIE